jgi:hypothetical protein
MARITKSNLAKKTTLPDLPDSNLLSRRRAQRLRVVATAPFTSMSWRRYFFAHQTPPSLQLREIDFPLFHCPFTPVKLRSDEKVFVRLSSTL